MDWGALALVAFSFFLLFLCVRTQTKTEKLLEKIKAIQDQMETEK